LMDDLLQRELPASGQPMVEIRKLRTEFTTPERKFTVHENLDLTMQRGEVLSLVGGSGTGKTVLLRQILGLETPARGEILVMGPPLLLLDEPTAGLDPESSDGFVTLLRSLHRDMALTVVMVTHDLDTLFELSTRIAVLAEKHVIINAHPKDVIAFQHPFIH